MEEAIRHATERSQQATLALEQCSQETFDVVNAEYNAALWV